MESRAGVAMRILFYSLALAVLAVALVGMPRGASAATIQTQTAQLLPVGSSTCIQVEATNFTPYVYDGGLDSFEFTMPDASYVAVVGSVGGRAIPLTFMTRRVDSAGSLRVHVDINSTPVTGTLPIEVTLLSMHGGGEPLCATVVHMTIGAGAIQHPATPTPKPSAPSTPATPAAPTPPVASTTTTPSTTPATPPGMPTTTPAAPVSITQNSLAGICDSLAGAYRLWLVLLVLYVLYVGFILFSERFVSWTWLKASEWRIASILVPLIVLLAFWYLVPACRSMGWMPVVAVIIAALGTFAALREHPQQMTQLLLIDQKK